jgi:hypothetical protein
MALPGVLICTGQYTGRPVGTVEMYKTKVFQPYGGVVQARCFTNGMPANEVIMKVYKCLFSPGHHMKESTPGVFKPYKDERKDYI